MDNDTMVAVMLKPCPFCGSSNIDAHGWMSLDAEGPACDDCGASAGSISQSLADNIAAWNTRHQSGRTGAGERETVARVIHQCLRPVNMANADWDSGAILGADNSWRRSVYSTADHILAALSQSTAGEDGA